MNDPVIENFSKTEDGRQNSLAGFTTETQSSQN